MKLRPDDLILRTRDLLDAGYTSATLRAAVRAGRLIRIRRGSYCDGDLWGVLDARRRHVILAAAVAMDADSAVFSGITAAAIWQIPIVGDWPREVTVIAPPSTGGKSEPGVRRTVTGWRSATVVTRSGLRVTTAARTVVDMAASLGLEAGVIATDWALAHGITHAELDAALDGRAGTRGYAAARVAVTLADGLAESPGESAARVAIFLAGFEVPVLQAVISDAEGDMRLDFFWPSVGIAGEFDGTQKYFRQEFTHGEPGEVVWREKKREDRARRQVRGMVRLRWEHLREPAALALMLTEAGVPRRRTGARAPLATTAQRAQLQLGGRPQASR